MEINVKDIEDIKAISLVGDIDANTSVKVQEKVLPYIESHRKILLDLSKVSYMSSAGLRMLLLLYRQTLAQSGKIVLVGLSEEIEDTMSVTGFLDFFTTSGTLEDGLAVLS
ncbi:MAG: anti-sigma factor antagonist [Cyanobacteria bacterium SID2]|nr:anti-sigma factor antagonist [Cyanobacteria bacterium SID2]